MNYIYHVVLPKQYLNTNSGPPCILRFYVKKTCYHYVIAGFPGQLIGFTNIQYNNLPQAWWFSRNFN